MEDTSHNTVFSALTELTGRASYRAPFVMESALDDDASKPTAQAGTFSRSRILWITAYGLMMLAFAWEAGFQFNMSPSTMNRMLSGALSVVGLLFCIKMFWKELTSSNAGSRTGADG